MFVAVSMVALALLVFSAQRQRTQATRALEARVAGTADMLAIGVALGLRSPDFSGITRAMAWARRDPAIVSAVVVDSSQQPIAQYTPPGGREPTFDLSAPLGRIIRRADVLTVAVPVTDGDDTLAILHLGVSMADAEREIRNDQRIALSGVLALSFVVLLFGALVARRISRPIEELRDAAVSLADGATPEFPAHGSVETAALGNAFRAMASRIRETHQELAESRDTALGATQAKSLFLATMSHELRTPMTGVLGMLDLLMRTSLSGRQETFARTARDSAESLLVLIDEILDFSKIEAGKLTLERVDFDPRALAEDVAGLLAERAHRKKLVLVCDVASDVPALVVGDPTRMRQILLNLGGNAIKFTSDGEVRIVVRAEQRASHETMISFAVYDSGLGMADEALAQLFTAFTQAEASTTRRFGGTGLGLSICRGLVDLMGGNIDVESSLGDGSVFTVRVPFVVSSGHDASTSDLSALHVLLIHEAGSQRQVLSTYLKDAGAYVSQCDSLESARRLQQDSPAHVILTPVGSTATSARAYVREMRESLRLSPLTSDARVVLLVTLDSPVLLEDASSTFSTLSLPVRRSTLIDAVLHAERVPLPSVAQPDAVADTVDSRRILVVEDNPVNREIAKYMLRELGHEVVLREDGKQALDILEHESFDLVLMDCQMPVLDGFSATRELRLREQATGNRTPVIALTANAVKGDREACLEAGMDDYLSKPYTRAQLAATCAQWLPHVASNTSPIV